MSEYVRDALDQQAERSDHMDYQAVLTDELEQRRDVIAAGLRAVEEARAHATVRLEAQAAAAVETVDQAEVEAVVTDWYDDVRREVGDEAGDIEREAREQHE